MPASRSQSGRGLGRALLVSVLVHVGGLALLGLVVTPTAPLQTEDSENEENDEQMRVEVVPATEREEPEPEEPERDESDPEPQQPEEADQPEEREEEEEEKKEREEREKTPTEQKSYNRKAVVQETNEEQPEEANFVSEQANKVEEETRARETVEEFRKPNKKESEREKSETEKSEKTDQKKLGSRKMASKARKPKKRRPPEPSEPQERRREREEREKTEQTEGEGPEPTREAEEETAEREEQKARPDRPPMPTVDDYSKVFDERADRRRQEERREKGVGSEMYREIEESEGSVQATLENYIPEVKPGNHTSVNAEADVAATYINRIHSKIHPRWGGTYLPRLDRRYGPGHQLSNSNLNAVLEFKVDGSTGELEEVTIVSSSGVTSYDMEAVTIAKQVAPHPEAPDPLVSPDGNVYLHWNFWRDQRQCGTFGVSLYKLTEEGVRERREAESGGSESGE